MSSSVQHIYWSRELERIRDPEHGFEYAARTYFRIQGKHAFGLPLFKFNNVQRIALQFLKDYQKEHGNIRVVIGKARQLGLSTFFTGLADHSLYFRRNRNALLVTHDEDTSKEMLGKHKIIYDGLPNPLRPQRSTNTATAMSFNGLNNHILTNHARNLNVGASLMQHIVHLSEVARYPDASTVQSSLFPSISDAKGVAFGDCSMVILESTSFVGGEWFKAFGEEAIAGRNGFGFLFIPWFKHEAYYTTPPRGFAPTPEELAWLNKYADDGLTWGNLEWRRRKKSEYQLSQLRGTAIDNGALFEQEFPFSWKDSWILPGGSSRVFTDGDLSEISQLKPGTPHWPTPKGLVRDVGACLEVFTPPKDGLFYHIGIDPSGGRTASSDFTAIVVVEQQTLHQVAEAQHRWDPASPEFLDFVYWLGKIYNNAQLNIDITGGWGQALLSFLQRKHYPYIWQRRMRDDVKERIGSRMGFVYSTREKANLISNAVVLANKHEPIIHSKTLRDELVTFLQFGLDEWGAAPGCYDDLANAWMLALLSANDERTEAQTPQEVSPVYTAPKVDRCFYHDPIALLHSAEKKPRFTKSHCVVHTERQLPKGGRHGDKHQAP